MHQDIVVRTSANPLAVQGRDWEVVMCGERWFGPDTLAACIEAQRVLEPIAREVQAVA